MGEICQLLSISITKNGKGEGKGKRIDELKRTHGKLSHSNLYIIDEGWKRLKINGLPNGQKYLAIMIINH